MLVGDPSFAARILGSLGSGIVGVDARGAVVLMNEGARAILGCPQGELGAAIGRHCRAVLAAQPMVARLLLEALEGRSALTRAELPLEGTEARASIGFTLSPVRDEGGAIRGSAILFRDLTSVERSDERDRLTERLAALGQMAAGLAHEIRNPLAGMEVLAGLLHRRLRDQPDTQPLVDDLLGELRQVAATVTASLDFVRPVRTDPEPVDPVELVEEALARARTRAARRMPRARPVVDRRFEGGIPPVAVDRELVGSAIANLIENAWEAMAAGDGRREARLGLRLECRPRPRPEPSVRVGALEVGPPASDAADRELVIAVSDTGPGVPPDLREKVFYPFFTTKQGGSGIGLARVQKIALAHGGSIDLESRPGEGSTFRLRLPVITGERRS